MVWLGGIKNHVKPYWHWIDGSEIRLSNYTNWASGFTYTAGQFSLAYLCFNAFNLEWQSCESYNTGVYAYVCEERQELSVASYRRPFESPVVNNVEPSSGLPGTLITITGRGFWQNITGHSQATDVSPIVTVGMSHCDVHSQSDTKIICALPEIQSGVVPVRVNTAFGDAGPGNLPLITVNHEV